MTTGTYCPMIPVQGLNVSVASTMGRFVRWSMGGSNLQCCTGSFFIQFLVGNVVPNMCQAGTYFTGFGISNPSQCTACEAGKFSIVQNAISSSVCSNCDVGKYSSTTASTVCLTCPTGTSSSGTSCTCTNVENGIFLNGACQCVSGAAYTTLNSNNVQKQCGATRDAFCTTLAKSNYGGYPAYYANDGNLDTLFHSETWSEEWWRLDMEKTQRNLRVKIYHRKDCCTDRSNGWKLWIGESTVYSNNFNCYTNTVNLAQIYEQTVDCLGSGRYLFVQVPINNWLQIRDIEVTRINQAYACISCSQGSYTTQGNSPTCSKCLSGSYANTTGASTCLLCSSGSYINVDGSSVCILCTPGAYSPAIGSTTCFSCSPGLFTQNSGSSMCMVCASGFYNNQYYSTTCFQCPINTFTMGAVAADSCVAIPGFFTTSQNLIQICPANNYCPANSTMPVLCPPNTISSAGSFTISNCTSSLISIDCPANHYCPAGSPQQCPANTGSSVGSLSITNCSSNPGFYGQPGFAATLCPSNHYCPASSTVPSPCPANSYAMQGSQNAHFCRCNAGYYCVYAKTVSAVISLKNVSVYAFENDIGSIKTSFINSLAVALNVSPSKVSITKVIATGSRRLLAIDSNQQNAINLRVYVNIYQKGKKLHTLSLHQKQKFIHFTIEKWNEQYNLKVIPFSTR